jgi:UDP-glucose 4-epimerase
MTTYLITGGAGFIGSHLTAPLLARGHSVIVLDDMSTGRARNLDSLRSHPNLDIVAGSVLDELIVDELVHQAEVVVHLAAAVGVKLIVEQPLRSFTTNIRGSEIVIGAAHRYRRKILVASTSEIYGKNGKEPLREDADRILGSTSVSRWSYSTAKAVDEILALAYHRERGLPSIVVRLFNTVGPGQSPAYGMVIPRMVRQAIAGLPVTVFGDGGQSRCFCHVDDTVAALEGLLEDPTAIGEIFNIGGPDEITILDLAKRIIELSESTSNIEFIPYDKAYPTGFEDMRRRVPDTTKIRSLTGWTPERSLDQILLEAVAEVRAEVAEATEHDGLVLDLTDRLPRIRAAARNVGS